jgi:hypothetical protein
VNRRTLYGAAASVLWLALAAVLAWSRRSAWSAITLNEWGDFFAGVVAPVAFLWLILGYLQQGEEVRSNTETLRLQQQALQQQVEGTAALVRNSEQQAKAAVERLELERSKYERLLAQEKARVQPVFGFVDGSGVGGSWEMKFRNSGGAAAHLKVTIDPPGGDVAISPDYVDRGGVGVIMVQGVASYPRYLLVSYVDQNGEAGVLRLAYHLPGEFRNAPLLP